VLHSEAVSTADFEVSEEPDLEEPVEEPVAGVPASAVGEIAEDCWDSYDLSACCP